MSNVDVLLTVGKLDASLALLTTQDHHVIEFPTMLLPDNIKAGSIVKFSVSQSLEEERRQSEKFNSLQTKILEKYGTSKPEKPVLKIVNITQTSCVLAWDELKLGSAKLKSLVLYRQGIRSMIVPSPLKITETKLSGLSIDHPYEFQLKLSTTSGNFWSEKINIQTHKMTDMSGIVVCLGPLDPMERITDSQISNSLKKIGAKELQHKVAIDTTHFICNDIDNEDDPELIKAKNNNIPIVRPEWVRACEIEQRIIGVRGFYLDADPSILKSYTFQGVSSGTEEPVSVEIPQAEVIETEPIHKTEEKIEVAEEDSIDKSSIEIAQGNVREKDQIDEKDQIEEETFEPLNETVTANIQEQDLVEDTGLTNDDIVKNIEGAQIEIVNSRDQEEMEMVKESEGTTFNIEEGQKDDDEQLNEVELTVEDEHLNGVGGQLEEQQLNGTEENIEEEHEVNDDQLNADEPNTEVQQKSESEEKTNAVSLDENIQNNNNVNANELEVNLEHVDTNNESFDKDDEQKKTKMQTMV
ncbi:hypothetical protein TPHA_0F00910 [Tetrapisispora phaffii CBS 4417]|uniref:Chitin biosynthesis protein CHS5 n=1 Tax=Tetrapisispora phaffii (strain ATCC 24235 / CBS 4417 / NBRC 1672 / NRRL Y-8282 / UCD 70-5) TaxID=1071381 RepID=G8BUZ5_TETPH|nr:hypothetical protein TPHA_0F00910 [Tetrapisispora phaffii CBS 4417]CCE63577.1 hypothetical protein TPHA_0F00910 [Tetrapisispora phaffii CBS 4417]